MNSPHIGGCTNAQPSNPATTRDIKGHLKPLDTNLNVAGIQTTTNDIDNIVTTTEVDADKVDTLQDSTGNDHITSGGGNDDIYTTLEGDNWVQAGSGRDWVRGGSGKDLVEGGLDADIYYQFDICLRPYLLGETSIRHPKTAQKVSPRVSASCRRTRSSIRNTINSIAACARKQGVRGRFTSKKPLQNQLPDRFTPPASSRRCVKRQKLRGRQIQGLSQAANVDLGSLA